MEVRAREKETWTKPTKSEEGKREQVNTANEEEGKILKYRALPIVPVIIMSRKNTDQCVTICTLLNSSSTRTFCSRKVANSLGLRGYTKKTMVTTHLPRCRESGISSKRDFFLHESLSWIPYPMANS